MNCRYYWGDDNIEYHLKWLDGAKSAHNLTIDYLGELHPCTHPPAWLYLTYTPAAPSALCDTGIWNERASDPDWIVRLRSAMDKAGHAHTAIVASDTNYQVCDDFVKNKTVSDAIGTCRCNTKDLSQFSLFVRKCIVLYSTALY
eukprot:COSAG02_NODE_874_length_16292_cov_11.828630_7_plen_144_part_00